MKKPVRQALGRGLSALISTPKISVVPNTGSNVAHDIQPAAGESSEGERLYIKYVSIDKVLPNPEQPRKSFSNLELEELATSIKSLGLIQPILVRKIQGEDSYQIIAGERRWRAAKLAQLTQIPIIIDNLADRAALEVALVENIQRQSLNPVEEALGYKRLSEEFNLTQAEIAQKVGRERASVANLIRLLALPEPVLELIRTGALSVGHAKALLTVREPSAQISLAKKSVSENLPVRALETLVSQVVVLDAGKRGASPIAGSRSRDNKVSPHMAEIVERMRRSLGTKVVIKHQASGKGKIELEYFSEQELGRLVDQICK